MSFPADQDVILWAARKAISTVRSDDQLRRLGIFCWQTARTPGVPVIVDERVILQVGGIGVALDDIGKRGMFNCIQGLWVEPLVFEPEPITVAQFGKLASDD